MWNLINLESKKLLTLCLKNSFTISLAESCTGGLISSAITHNPRSSEIYKKGYIDFWNLCVPFYCYYFKYYNHHRYDHYCIHYCYDYYYNYCYYCVLS